MTSETPQGKEEVLDTVYKGLRFETLLLRTQNKVLYVTINRATVLNALNQLVIQEMRQLLKVVKTNADTRVVVIAGAGDKAFVAGADIAAMQSLSREQAHAFAIEGQLLTMELESLPQITIARVPGYALGGGMELMMSCDIVIAAKTAKFGQPETSLGIIPGFGGTQRLTRRVGLALAMDMLTTGRMLSGEEAGKCGLVTRVVDISELDHEVERVIAALKKSGPEALARTKSLTLSSTDCSLTSGLSMEAEQFGEIFTTKDAKEGISAFLQKRKANFVEG